MDQARLRELESRCIQEEPPRCAAACPLHVDARALCGLVAQGDWARAWGVLQRHMPLPGVLARVDQPCRAACLRGQLGEPILVGGLERAVVQTPEPRARTLPVPRRPGRALVAGAGPSGLAAAWDLARKGWGVTLATAAGRAGGLLLGLPEGLLPPEALAAELQRLASLGVTLGLGVTLPDISHGPPDGHDAAILALDDPGSGLALPGAVPDPLTLALDGAPGLFVCGQAGQPVSWVGLMASGRKAAASVDRHLQNVSLTVGRDEEGPFATRLFTNIEGLAPLAQVPMADPAGYAPDEARAEAGRCLDCQCLECVKACRFLSEFKAYPKVYARQIYNNEAIVKGHHTANILVDSCMLCGLCTAVCPEDFPMAEACLASRQGMVARGKMPPSAFEFGLEDMAQANSDHCFLARPAPGREDCELLFFPGCQLAGSSPERVAAAYRHLLAAHGAGLWLGCCGAPAQWAGRSDLFEATMAAMRAAWQGLGRPTLLMACPNCLATVRQGLPEAEVDTLWEFYARHGLPAPPGATPQAPLAVHDPCTARDAPQVRRAARQVLAGLGAAGHELPHYAGQLARCCGFGGLLHSANPPLSDAVAAQRAAEDEADYVTYCAMCRDRLARSGKRVSHLLDLLFAGPGEADPASRPDPGFSWRRENRARLRSRLRREIWGEEDETMPGPDISLRLEPEVAARLEERRIMAEDVRAVIARAEESGQRLADPATGRLLARARPRAVTFWVEYAPEGDGFRVHNAWCHRMAVKGEPS